MIVWVWETGVPPRADWKLSTAATRRPRWRLSAFFSALVAAGWA